MQPLFKFSHIIFRNTICAIWKYRIRLHASTMVVMNGVAMMVRGLALGEVEPADFLRVLGKEIRVSAIVGAVLGIVNGLRIYLMYTFLFPGQYENVIGYAIVVSVSLFFSVILAKLVGGMLPLAAKKLGADPAIMATPFITTICLLYTSPSPRDGLLSRMPSSA